MLVKKKSNTRACARNALVVYKGKTFAQFLSFRAGSNRILLGNYSHNSLLAKMTEFKTKAL
jgi:hypothetical protein